MATLSGVEHRTLIWIRSNPGQSGTAVIRAIGEPAQKMTRVLGQLGGRGLIARTRDGERRLHTITALGEIALAQSAHAHRNRSRAGGA